MSSPAVVRPPREGLAFAALRHGDFRVYVTGATLSMMADNIEHVITYWVLWETFHSPLLAGFAVVSHWLPFLLLSVYFGGLADKYDCRRVIQASQGLFMLVSISWGVLFVTGHLQVWHAMLLLSLHGMAGAIWGPAEQLMLHDIVGRKHLESAVRLNSTGRTLGVLLGPAVGGAILLLAGPAIGIFINALIYLPLSLSLLRVKSNGHQEGATARKVTIMSALQALRDAGGNRAILSMIAMAGMASFLIGSFSPQMPEFARDFQGLDSGGVYAALLIASGLGAVLGGIALEATRFAKVTVAASLAAAGLWGCAVAGFAITRSFPTAIVFLFIAGMAQLAFNSMAQTIVQMQAPAESRGRLIGAFAMAQQGMKTGSGISVGVIGSTIGIHSALMLAAALTAVLALGMLAFANSAPAMVPALVEATGEEWIPQEPPCC